MKNGLYFILTISFWICLGGCDSTHYSKSFSFSDELWQYDDPRSFEFTILDTTKVYDMMLNVGHTDHFPYQNLYLKTSTVFPSETVLTQELSIELANEAGFWFGNCDGTNCSISIPIQSKIRFNEIGAYALQLEQHTRTDSLYGLRNIELRIVATE